MVSRYFRAAPQPAGGYDLGQTRVSPAGVRKTRAGDVRYVPDELALS